MSSNSNLNQGNTNKDTDDNSDSPKKREDKIVYSTIICLGLLCCHWLSVSYMFLKSF